jgi:hypothetical protein
VLEFFEGFMGNRSKFLADALKYLIQTKRAFEVVMVSKNGGFSEYYRQKHPEIFNVNSLEMVTEEDLPSFNRSTKPTAEKVEKKSVAVKTVENEDELVPEEITSPDDRLSETMAQATVRPSASNVSREVKNPLPAEAASVYDM